MKQLLISLIILVSIPLGHTDDQAVYLTKGQPAPFTGYLITQDQANTARKNSIDLGAQLKINIELMDENSLLNQRLSNAQQQDTFLSKQLVDEQDKGFFSKAGYFLLGAGITGLLAYGTEHALK